mgnify:CR=1 FL=1
MRGWLVLAAMILLAGCVRVVPEAAPPRAAGTPPPVVTVASAAFAGLAPGPSVSALGIAPGARARQAFLHQRNADAQPLAIWMHGKRPQQQGGRQPRPNGQRPEADGAGNTHARVPRHH